MIPRMVGLVADDLTGATDSAVQFAAAGWSAHLLRRPLTGPDVVASDLSGPGPTAVVTGVRAAGEEAAAADTAAAVRNLLARGCDRLYIKIDSTMRGSVAGQLRGALAAWSAGHPGAVAVLRPAFPDQGRTVVGGDVLVGGVPLARTAAAADPVTPVIDSRLARLVPGAIAATPSDLDLDVAPRRSRSSGCSDTAAAAERPDRPGACHTVTAPTRPAGSSRATPAGSTPAAPGGVAGEPDRSAVRLVFVDAATDADLDGIAAGVDRLGPCGVAAGSAGLAAALARRWSVGRAGAAPPVSPMTRILVGVSSLHPVALGSLDRLRSSLAEADAPGRPTVDVITTQAARADPAVIAAGFGEQVAEQLARAPYDALVLVGGDGASATLDRVGAAAITVHAALAPGVPIGRIRGGAAHGVRVVTTSGGFGNAGSLTEIIDRLRSSAPQQQQEKEQP